MVNTVVLQKNAHPILLAQFPYTLMNAHPGISFTWLMKHIPLKLYLLHFTEGYYKVTLHNHDTFVHHVHYGMLAFKAFTCHQLLSFKCWQLWLVIVTLIIYCHLIQSIELLSTNMGALLWLNAETLERTPTPLLANLEGSLPMDILFTSHDYNTSYSLASHTL